MKMIHLPKKHAILSSAMFFYMLLFVMNLWVFERGNTEKILQNEKLLFLSIVFLWVCFTFYWLIKVQRIAFVSIISINIFLVTLNFYFLSTTKNYAIVFYILFLVIIFSVYCFQVFKSLNEVYFNPGHRWFEGSSKVLPNIQAEFQIKNKTIYATLSRLGLKGGFAYSLDEHEMNERLLDQIVLKSDDLKLQCKVRLICREKTGRGWGFQFIANDLDVQKDIYDFVDRVRSFGYVS